MQGRQDLVNVGRNWFRAANARMSSEKLQHWCGLARIFGLKAATVLEFYT
jgi:hypothetical protein